MILKLKDGGEAVPFFVQRVDDDVSKRGKKEKQYKFSGRTPEDDNATLWVFADTAERQFARIGLDRSSIVGQWVEFAKTENGYVDITRPERGAVPAKPITPSTAATSSNGHGTATERVMAKQDAPAPAAAADPDRAAKKDAWLSAKKCYDACVDHVIATSVPKLEKLNIPFTHEGIAAEAATLFRRCIHADLV